MKTIIIILVLLFISEAAESQIADSVIWRVDTVGNAAPDSLSRLAFKKTNFLYQKWGNNFSFAILADSISEVSDTVAFSAGRTLKIAANTSYSSEQLKTTKFKNLFIRKFSTAPGVMEYVISAKGY